MGNLQRPEPFNMKDLTLDVRLQTCIDGTSHDFTGKKTFDTSFYRENIGFGITDIQIEVNPSLQPSIEITFKDLYGNTIFGSQRGRDDEIDTSVLFNWPPPKFIFSFKGYLGRMVTWLLNLKTTNVSYVPSDGSYEIKCSFVPNQWGFLADIPVLYLLACKKLRVEKYGGRQKKISEKCIFDANSIFSYIRVGKQVETKTKENTKDFEPLTNQLTALRANPSNAIFQSKNIEFDSPIIGVVNSQKIIGFTNLLVPAPVGDTVTVDSLKKKSIDSSRINELNNYLQSNVKFNTKDDVVANFEYANSTKKAVNYETSTTLDDKTLTAYKSALNKIIDNDLFKIDEEIKRRTFNSSKREISKLTIGEVFKQISRDSAFILGSILEVGIGAYAKNVKGELGPSNRNNPEGGDDLIGVSFPLYVNDKGVEVPAAKPINIEDGKGPVGDYGVDSQGGEMDFVNKFIVAIGEGIAENLITDEVAGGDDKVPAPVNMLEAIRGNPYKSTYINIAENVLIRSGIMAYVTRSSSLETPGDYGTFWSVDRDGEGDMKTIAESDIESNLKTEILSQLSFEDKASLRRFCKFWVKLLSDDGNEFLRPYDNEKNGKPGFQNLNLTLPAPGGVIPDVIMKYKIIVDDYSDENVIKTYDALSDAEKDNDVDLPNKLLAAAKILNPNKKAFQTLSIEQLLVKELLKGEVDLQSTPAYIFGIAQDPNAINKQRFYNTATINTKTLTATNVKNNGIHYQYPQVNANEYYYVLFNSSEDVDKTKSVTFSSGSVDEEDWDNDEPIGFIPINTPFKDDEDKEVLGRVERLNKEIENNFVIDYSKLTNFYITENASTGLKEVDNSKYLWKRKIQTTETVTGDEIEAKNLSFAVYAASPGGPGEFTIGPNAVFGPFVGFNDNRGRNQRICIKFMCKKILEKLDKIDEETNQIIGDVIGKANESRNLIYKQMHTIFHQWQIIASSIDGKNLCNKNLDSTEGLAEKLELEYGNCESHINKPTDKNLDEVDIGGRSTLFVYDYPLASVRADKENLHVQDSIINIEPIYKPNANTTVLNIIQQICTKNNFIFVPFPGDANSDNINDIYTAHPNPTAPNIKNYFHVLFTPTPETRSKLRNDSNDFTTDYKDRMAGFQNSAISISFGSVNNQIIKSVNVGTDSTKPTAESILNLQRLVDKENTNKQSGMDCSMLPVYEGRSFKASVDMIGNAQVYPMQYFFIENMPMFGGLYQIMKVSHSITPNNMTTSVEGIRMRFSVNGGYGGIEPITLKSLQKLSKIEEPMFVGSSSFVSITLPKENRSVAISGVVGGATALSDLKITDEFIDLVKDIKFHNLNDVDKFIKDNTDYSTFLEFFNKTQANKGYYGDFKEIAHIHQISQLSKDNLNPIFNNIYYLFGTQGANFFEIFSVWCTSLSESTGMGVVEGINSIKHPKHPGIAYTFDEIDWKSSYNAQNSLGNLTVLDSLKNAQFKSKFNTSTYSTISRKLFASLNSVWAGTQMPKNILDLCKNEETNILVHTDFFKFRGRGLVQITGRSSYKTILKSLLQTPLLTTGGGTKLATILAQFGSQTIDDANLTRILNTSTNKQWDDIFTKTEGTASCIAHKKFMDVSPACKGLKVDTSMGGQNIVTRLITLGGGPTGTANVAKEHSSNWRYQYGEKNAGRVVQIIASLGKTPSA